MTLPPLPPLPPLAIRVLVEVLVIIAAIWDIRSRRIPNWLTLPGVILGVGVNTFLFETNGLKFSLIGLGFAFVVYFVLYLLHAMGAGDVKLMAAVGAAVGPASWFVILLLTTITGAIAGLILVAFKGRLRRTFANVGIILMSLGRGRAPYKDTPELDVNSDQGMRLPHGALIAIATLGFLVAELRWAPR
jgi:prepilin peptidase CpaA